MRIRLAWFINRLLRRLQLRRLYLHLKISEISKDIKLSAPPLARRGLSNVLLRQLSMVKWAAVTGKGAEFNQGGKGMLLSKT